MNCLDKDVNTESDSERFQGYTGKGSIDDCAAFYASCSDGAV
jgi:hypothetical protein